MYPHTRQSLCLPGSHVVGDRADVLRAKNAGRPRWAINCMPKDKLLEPVKRRLQRRLRIVRAHVLFPTDPSIHVFGSTGFS